MGKMPLKDKQKKTNQRKMVSDTPCISASLMFLVTSQITPTPSLSQSWKARVP